jgi:hypothetical protein
MKPTCIKGVQESLAAAIKKEIGAVVEFTMRAPSLWTISGAAKCADAAMALLSSRGIARETNRAHDDELDETFIYCTTAK